MCTRVFWNDNGVAMVVARSLDWETSDEPRLWVIPRGVERSGVAGPGSIHWTTVHGSVTMQGWAMPEPSPPPTSTGASEC